MNPGQTPLTIIPAVDVLEGKVVRLLKGDYGRVTEYGPDPVAAALRWMDEGAELVHVVDLEGARSGATDFALWERVASAGVSFQAGGGIRTAVDALAVLGIGAQRVVMGTKAVWDPAVLAEVEPHAVAAVDVRGEMATGAGWRGEGRHLESVLDGLAAAGVGRLLVTGIGRDGTLEGPDIDLTKAVVDDERFSVIASGGVGALADLDSLVSLGCEAVIVGRALYEGRFSLEEALGRVGR
ncbi:bifunctional 1-(5-phosphoribosyl)-5-((5-phosphoribosylamino)methylideneamino)imidazole-4-carboxamide isomerase/phosphoribosylanthranilate isomerase PriA [soil metagenome]